MKMLRNLFCIIFTLVLVGCAYEFPTHSVDSDPVPGDGDNIRNFIVVGGNITSGIMDGAFHSEGVQTAYPNLIGNRLDSVFQENVYGILTTSNEKGYNLTHPEQGDIKGRFRLSYREIASGYPARIANEGIEIEDFSGNIDSVNNFSVPKLRSYQVHHNDSLSGNPFFDRFSSQLSDQNLIELVITKNPKLVLLSLGTGDIYPYILEGASGRIDPPANDIRDNDATPLPIFKEAVEEAVEELLSNTQADIILPTIIDPTQFFYFNTLNWYFDQDEIDIAEAIEHYTSFNEGVQEFNNSNSDKRRPVIAFDFEPSRQWRAKVFVDDLLPQAEANDGTVIPQYRQMTYEENMLYSAEQKQYNSIQSNKTFATTEPADDRYVITVEEGEIINNLITSYNNVLQSIANEEDRVFLLDFYNLINGVKDGAVNFNGVSFNTGFEQNSIVSSDGYSLNKKGQALLANRLLKFLNTEYGTKFKPFNVNIFKGNEVELNFGN